MGRLSKQTARYGLWESPLTAARVTAGALRLDQIQLDGDTVYGNTVYWVEGRASEGGRNVIVRRTPDGRISDVTPPGFNVRSRAHEYGGAAYVVHRGTVYFSNFSDQKVYRQAPGEAPRGLTPDGYFYADYRVDIAHNRLLCVREDHTRKDREAINTIVALPLSGESAGTILASGADFFSDPVVNADGTAIAWLQWRHPNMPWDGTELWRAALNRDGTVGAREKVAGGVEESIFQPEWSPDGTLYFVSDRTGWWNLYRSTGGKIEPVHLMPAEFGKPQWTFTMCTYAFISATRIAASYVQDGCWRLALIDTDRRTFEPIELGVEPFESIRADAGAIYFVGGSPTEPEAITRVMLSKMEPEVLRASADKIDAGWVSIAEPVTFMVDGQSPREVHAFYYPPKNPNAVAPAGDKPPLLVLTHGGPTSATTDVFDPEILFWTSRGFALLDVNYSGSTGYGRAYRDRLRGQWGIVDVEDVVGAAKAMVAQGKADPKRLLIRGGSAGGYTTLAALTFHDTFSAGASYYGVSDIEVLAHDTHKFESRYLDTLIGPYPAAKDTYYQRSPIHFTDRLSCPLILFQGLEDKVVPPNQSEMMADALRKKGVKVRYVTFEGEQHGFRKAENIITALEDELTFYREIFV